jgi:hypothetical protein
MSGEVSVKDGVSAMSAIDDLVDDLVPFAGQALAENPLGWPSRTPACFAGPPATSTSPRVRPMARHVDEPWRDHLRRRRDRPRGLLVHTGEVTASEAAAGFEPATVGYEPGPWQAFASTELGKCRIAM